MPGGVFFRVDRRATGEGPETGLGSRRAGVQLSSPSARACCARRRGFGIAHEAVFDIGEGASATLLYISDMYGIFRACHEARRLHLRVSTVDQRPETQLLDLRHLAVQRVLAALHSHMDAAYTEKTAGLSRTSGSANRPIGRRKKRHLNRGLKGRKRTEPANCCSMCRRF